MSKKCLGDINLVGQEKLIGYLPLKTITEICKADPIALQAEAQAKGFEAMILSESECSIGSGALYIADIEHLQEFLSTPENIAVLQRHEWPIAAKSFLMTVIAKLAPVGPLYDLVALAYGDRRPEYRSRNAMRETMLMRAEANGL